MKKFLMIMLLCLFTLPALGKNTILILGDSISAAHGIDPKQGWVTLLQQRLNVTQPNDVVINASISGDTTSNGLARLPAALKQYQPQITVIELGGNDGLRGLQPFIIKTNLQKMMTLIKEANSQVLLLGMRIPPNYGPVYTEKFQQIYSELASENDSELVPIFLKGVDDNPKLMQSDGIHPTAEAQMIMLNNVWPTVQKLLTKP